jgi:hypothetical protein
MTIFSIALVAVVIVSLAAVDPLNRWRHDADLRRRWHDRQTRRC